MVTTDPIADMLTRIRNANDAYHEKVDMPASKIKAAVLEILKNEGFIKNVEQIEVEGHQVLRVVLKYGANREKVIKGLKRISKPGLRVYAGHEELPKVLGGLGIAIISTSKGIKTDKAARKEGLGGEVLAYVWQSVGGITCQELAKNRLRFRQVWKSRLTDILSP